MKTITLLAPLALLFVSGCEAEPDPPVPPAEPTPLAWVEVEPDLCAARGLSTSTGNLQTAYDVLGTAS